MWGYYGSKSKIISKYPAPIYNTIIEPFAGTAQYALKYWDKEIILIEKYDVICNLWKWLQKCSEKDILTIRQLKYGESTDNFQWDCQEQKDLVGFIITGAPSIPKKTASRWKTVERPNTQQFRLETIANNLHKIRHWKIICGDYTEAPDIIATWFIDPPYVVGGKYYKYGSKYLDYNFLGNWCKQKQGQVIVCEAEGQNWLPFKPLVSSRGNKYQHKEVMWTNQLPLIEPNQLPLIESKAPLEKKEILTSLFISSNKEDSEKKNAITNKPFQTGYEDSCCCLRGTSFHNYGWKTYKRTFYFTQSNIEKNIPGLSFWDTGFRSCFDGKS